MDLGLWWPIIAAARNFACSRPVLHRTARASTGLARNLMYCGFSLGAHTLHVRVGNKTLGARIGSRHHHAHSIQSHAHVAGANFGQPLRISERTSLNGRNVHMNDVQHNGMLRSLQELRTEHQHTTAVTQQNNAARKKRKL